MYTLHIYLLIHEESLERHVPLLSTVSLYYLTYFRSARAIFDLNWILYLYLTERWNRNEGTQQEKQQQAGGQLPLLLLLFFTCDDDAAANLFEKAPNGWNKRKYRNKIPERKYQISWVHRPRISGGFEYCFEWKMFYIFVKSINI